MCVTCNVQTQCVKSYQDHPIKDYMDAGIRVTVNTDNRLISDTNLTEEYHKVISLYGLTARELRNLILNGFKAAFIPYQERKVLLEEVSRELDLLLS